MHKKFFWGWELKTSQTGTSTIRFQFTLTTHLGLPGPSSNLPCHLIQLTTIMWWSVDTSAPLFTQNIWPQVWWNNDKGDRWSLTVDHWRRVNLRATQCLNMVFIKSKNKALSGCRSGKLFLPIALLQDFPFLWTIESLLTQWFQEVRVLHVLFNAYAQLTIKDVFPATCSCMGSPT